MSKQFGTGLARVTVASPQRRIDVALPETVALSELLPGVLQHAEEGLADDGEKHGGWLLRRSDGSRLATDKSLGAQGVRDGEVLHLHPAQADWPEPDYDDVVDAIATGAGRYRTSWSPNATRITGLAVVGLLLTLGLVVVGLSGPKWIIPGGFTLGIALVLLAAGTILSRVLSDAPSGAIIAGYGLPYAAAGGALLLGYEGPLTRQGTPQLLVGSLVLLTVSMLGYLATADYARIFVAGVTVGLSGAVAAGLAYTGLSAVQVGTLVLSATVVLTPAFPLLAIRLGKMPLPALPRTAADLIEEQPVPEVERVLSAVARADEMLTGLFAGACLVIAVSEVVLTLNGGFSAMLLVGLCAAASLLRARVLVSVRHRVPLLAAGLVGMSALALGMTLAMPGGLRTVAVLSGLVVIAALVLGAGFSYSRKPPSPYLGRAGDILDGTLLVFVIPVACAALGVYEYARGIFG